jgi:hypothetical protein
MWDNRYFLQWEKKRQKFFSSGAFVQLFFVDNFFAFFVGGMGFSAILMRKFRQETAFSG